MILNSKKINRLTVAKYYLKSELGNIFSDDLTVQIEKMIDSLSENKVWRFLEALSFTYRLNGVFWKISDLGISWKEEEVLVKDIVLTGISPDVNEIIKSDEIKHNPVAFANYLKNLQSKNENISEELMAFLPRKEPIFNKYIIISENDNVKRILDGSHRLISMILSGQEKVMSYTASCVGESKPKRGDSTFWLLKIMYEESSSDEDKEAILKVVKIMSNKSSDGLNAIKEYWVNHADEKFKPIGKKLLSELE